MMSSKEEAPPLWGWGASCGRGPGNVGGRVSTVLGAGLLDTIWPGGGAMVGGDEVIRLFCCAAVGERSPSREERHQSDCVSQF